MKLRLYTIGKPKLRFAALGVEEYERRLSRAVDFRIESIKARDESDALLARSDGSYRVALDERGLRLTTTDVVAALDALENRGDVKTVSFLIGGADGHSSELRARADAVWSLSPLTLQHELALVVLLEQLYRAYAIKRGEPYHR